jgi:hypothetical protein
VQIEAFKQLAILGLLVDTAAQHILNQRQDVDVHMLPKGKICCSMVHSRPPIASFPGASGSTRFAAATSNLCVSRDRYADGFVKLPQNRATSEASYPSQPVNITIPPSYKIWLYHLTIPTSYIV